jgi:exopolysaccharide biosynthesis polyprenyl glycosylphosphotransferase
MSMRSSRSPQQGVKAQAEPARSKEIPAPANSHLVSPRRLGGSSGVSPSPVSPARTNLGGRQPAILGRREEINLQLNQLIDAAILVACLYLAYAFRQFLGTQIRSLEPMESISAYIWLVVLIMPFGPLLLDLQGFYSVSLQKTAVRTFTQAMQALLWLCVLIGACAILFKLRISSRSVLILFTGISAVVLLLKERIRVVYLRNRARRGQYRERVVLAGSTEEIEQFTRRVGVDVMAEVDIVETIDISREPIPNLVRALHQHSVGRVIFSASRAELSRVEEAIAACEIEGVEAWLVADFIRTSIARPAFDVFGIQPMLVFRSTPDVSWTLLVKRTVDFLGALAGLVALAPVLLATAMAIKLTSPGPAIFSQARCGKHGRPFRMYKFRSMYSDAEQRRHELETYNQMSGPVFKFDNDPRITPLGRILRKYSIDELPQLVNVLLGHMSLVGPRPLPTYEVENFANTAQRRRLSVKPGLTCLWQISGRNRVRDFETWVKLDLEYIDNWSIWLDFRILLHTVPAVLLADGAT